MDVGGKNKRTRLEAEDSVVHLGYDECNLPLSFPSVDAKYAVKYMQYRNEILYRELNLGAIDIYIETEVMNMDGWAWDESLRSFNTQ